jgi:hypothetical protein
MSLRYVWIKYHKISVITRNTEVCIQCGCFYDRVHKAQVYGKLILCAQGRMLSQRALVVLSVAIIAVQLYGWSEMKTHFYISK